MFGVDCFWVVVFGFLVLLIVNVCCFFRNVCCFTTFGGLILYFTVCVLDLGTWFGLVFSYGFVGFRCLLCLVYGCLFNAACLDKV